MINCFIHYLMVQFHAVEKCLLAVYRLAFTEIYIAADLPGQSGIFLQLLLVFRAWNMFITTCSGVSVNFIST